MKNDTRARFTLRIPQPLFEAIGNEACEQGVPINSLILQILWDWKSAHETRNDTITQK